LKVVLDTNVLVSAFLSPRGNAARILRLIIQGDVFIVLNESILAVYYEVLKRPKFELDMEAVLIVIDYIRSIGINAPALAISTSLPDHDDEPFLEAALATQADALVTGNMKHFPKKFCKGQKVTTPRDFLDSLKGD
jgi:putative PIN family toxin of toxin-antitoxin system